MLTRKLAILVLLNFLVVPQGQAQTTTVLRFPLRTRDQHIATINAVFDHSMAGAACQDKIVSAYTGEIGQFDPHSAPQFSARQCGPSKIDDPSLRGWRMAQDSLIKFIVNCNYTGKEFLFYDGHPGYDFNTTDSDQTTVLPGQPGRIPVLAAASGTVHFQVGSPQAQDPRGQPGGEFGTMEIFHDNGRVTRYLHLDRSSFMGGAFEDGTPRVKNGQWVNAGDRIATAGDTGTAKAHLHFEVRDRSQKSRFPGVVPGLPLDPYGWHGLGQDPYLQKNPGVVINNRPFWAEVRPKDAWNKESQEIKPPGETAVNLGSPELVCLGNNQWRMYYADIDSGQILSADFKLERSVEPTGEIVWKIIWENQSRRVSLVPGGEPGTPTLRVGGSSIVRLEDGTYRMYYAGVESVGVPGGGRIYSAKSVDGRTFNMKEGRVLDLGAPDEPDAFSADGPFVVSAWDGKLRMYYRCVDKAITAGGKHRICSATSPDGKSFQKEGIGQERVRLREDDGDVNGVSHFFVMLTESGYRMYYTVAGALDPAHCPPADTSSPCPVQIRAAVSTNGLDWKKLPGTVLGLGGAGTLDSKGVAKPFIIRLPPPDGLFQMFYQAAGDGLRIVRSTSPSTTGP